MTASTLTSFLSPDGARRTSARVTAKLFDEVARAKRRNRALRSRGDFFLHQRAFEDVIERLELVGRHFRSAVLLGCADHSWVERLQQFADRVEAIDDESELEPATHDLCVSVGTLETSNDVPRSLLFMRFALRPDSLLVGAVAGGDTLPRLAAAMRAADAEMGSAVPHMHPRLEPSALAGLLSQAGFQAPVVDVDRVQVSYRSIWDLVRDLRAMGATNTLAERSRRPLSRAAADAAVQAFAADAEEGRVIERFELLHFAAWVPSGPPPANG